ncbi:MAG TPA: TonB-dependent receptor, partial [Brevundimonas sp.]|nr:TonB-dependent receptor [Brevundimonas sp.]
MRFLLLATASAVCLPLSAYAQSAEETDALPEVVVTATRLPAVALDSPGARVIDRSAIERRGAVFAADI